MIVCAALMGVFVFFLWSMIALGANVRLMGFSGLLFLLNILSLLALIVAFWIGYCNLLELMWILAFYTPASLFIMNRGLARESSEVN